MHVVIIDPSRVVQGKIAAELEAAGNYVDCFSNSELALAHIQSNRTVDVVITSLEIEPIPGLELCWNLRTIAGDNRPLHIIVMSSNNTERALSEALDCGADDFIVKPVGREELKARLRAADRIMILQRQLIEQARKDTLTNLLNRRAFFEDMLERRADLDPTDKFTVCYCDIDNFKKVNDVHGHDAGDLAIQLVARLATEEAPIVARLGGEEFAFGFPILDMEEAARWCEVIRKNVASSEITGPTGPFNVTCSFGLAEWQPGETLHSVLTRADKALLEAKRAGRNCVKLAEEPALAPAA